MAVDTSDTNTLKVTFQFTKASTVSESGSSGEDTTILNSVDASSISSAINLMNAYIGKELSLSHCKLIVFSEEIAQKGISDEIYTLMNDNQIRPSTNVVISKCNAKYYIENSKPIFEPLITKYYELYTNSSSYTGYTTNATSHATTSSKTIILIVKRNEDSFLIVASDPIQGMYKRQNNIKQNAFKLVKPSADKLVIKLDIP